MVTNNSQVQRWCFTLNQYDEDFNYRNHFLKYEFKVRRGVWGKEIAPETGTRHLQGYLELFRSFRLGHMRKILPGAHWSPARGTSLQNYDYCIKGEWLCSYLAPVSLLDPTSIS